MPQGNCTDDIWLTDMVLTATKTWFVLAGKIAKPNDLDPTKKFTDAPYSIAFPTFLQFCDYMAGRDDGSAHNDGPGKVNQALVDEGCAQHVVLTPAWRQKHQRDVIADFVEAVVRLILNPPITGV